MPVRYPLTRILTFTNERMPQSVDDLDAIGREQLRVCGLRWDGEDLPPEQRLFPTDAENDTNLSTRMLAIWDVIDGTEHVYDAWFYAVDSGVMFRARTTEVVCVVVQFDFQPENAGDSELAVSLTEAAKRARAI